MTAGWDFRTHLNTNFTFQIHTTKKYPASNKNRLLVRISIQSLDLSILTSELLTFWITKAFYLSLLFHDEPRIT